jgi:hypothetical protein
MATQEAPLTCHHDMRDDACPGHSSGCLRLRMAYGWTTGHSRRHRRPRYRWRLACSTRCSPPPGCDGWCYLVGFVHTASGCAVFQPVPPGLGRLAPALRGRTGRLRARRQCRSPEAGRAGARTVQAAPPGQIGQIGHTSLLLKVPDQVPRLFLPPHPPRPNSSPPSLCGVLTDAALVNRRCATLDDLEEAQAACCIAP